MGWNVGFAFEKVEREAFCLAKRPEAFSGNSSERPAAAATLGELPRAGGFLTRGLLPRPGRTPERSSEVLTHSHQWVFELRCAVGLQRTIAPHTPTFALWYLPPASQHKYLLTPYILYGRSYLRAILPFSGSHSSQTISSHIQRRGWPTLDI